MTTLEERVAALEELIAYPQQAIKWRGPEMTADEKAGLEARIRQAAGSGYQQIAVLPPRPLLTPEDVLVISVPDTWTNADAGRADSLFRDWASANAPWLKVLIVPEGRQAVMQPGHAAAGAGQAAAQ